MSTNTLINCEEKDLIWVPKKFAKAYARAKSEEKQLEILEEILSKQKRDIKQDLENLDYDVTQFKASILRYKKAFKEVYEENAKQVYALWEEIEKTKPSQAQFINQLKNDLKPIMDEVKLLSEFMKNVNTYYLEKFLALINSVVSCDNETKEFILKVIEFSLQKDKEK